MNIATSIEDYKKLKGILPLESSDMHYCFSVGNYTCRLIASQIPLIRNNYSAVERGRFIPAWSLAALLDVLPKIINNETLFIETSAALWHIGYRNIYTARADNPIDACVEIITKLHEEELL